MSKKEDTIWFMIFLMSILIVFIGHEIIFVSANGLILSTNNFTLTQIYNQTQTIQLSITNTEPNIFYNITIENNPYISFSQISELDSGQTVNVTGNIIGINNFNGNLRISGYYVQNVGVQNKTWNINITYPDGINNCSLSIIKGDKVIFYSNVNDNVNLKNQNTNQLIYTISPLGTYTINFDNPQILDYATYRIGFPFGPTCRISCLDDSGYVNNPLFDSLLNINLIMSYPPTILNYTLLINSYTVNFFDTSQDAFSITNTGSNVAKNISLSGDWFSFNKQGFDLNPGQSTTVVYTLKSKIGYTNDTNKSWSQTFNITGNFPTLTIPFTVFINYANIDNGNLNSYGTNQSFMDYVCSLYPQFCQNNTIIVYRTVDNGSLVYNVSVGQDQLNQMFQKEFSIADQNKLFQDYQKEHDNNVSNDIISIKEVQSNLTTQFYQLQANQNSSNDFSFFIIIMLLIFAICGLMFYIYYILRKEKLSKKKEIY